MFAYLRDMARLALNLRWHEKVLMVVVFSAATGLGRWAAVALLHMPTQVR